jgi:hypothetical protein
MVAFPSPSGRVGDAEHDLHQFARRYGDHPFRAGNFDRSGGAPPETPDHGFEPEDLLEHRKAIGFFRETVPREQRAVGEEMPRGDIDELLRGDHPGSGEGASRRVTTNLPNPVWATPDRTTDLDTSRHAGPHRRPRTGLVTLAAELRSKRPTILRH